MKTYYISEVAKILSVHKGTIRNYQKKGLVDDKRSPANNYRIFNDADIDILRTLINPKVITIEPLRE